MLQYMPNYVFYYLLENLCFFFRESVNTITYYEA